MPNTKEENKTIKILEEKLIKSTFAGGIFSDTDGQKMYTNGYEDGYNACKKEAIEIVGEQEKPTPQEKSVEEITEEIENIFDEFNILYVHEEPYGRFSLSVPNEIAVYIKDNYTSNTQLQQKQDEYLDRFVGFLKSERLFRGSIQEGNIHDGIDDATEEFKQQENNKENPTNKNKGGKCSHEKFHTEIREYHADGDMGGGEPYTATVCDICGEELLEEQPNENKGDKNGH